LSCFKRFGRHESGSAFITVALAAPAVIGGLALAIDTGYLFMAKRRVQQQADAAAVGVVRAKAQGVDSLSTLNVVATNDAVRNGYVDAAPNTLAVNIPPTSGAYVGDGIAVEVIVQTNEKSFFARYFNLASANLRGRAVARLKDSEKAAGGGCVLALHTSASGALQFQGSGNVTAPTCTLVSNSTAADSIYVGGSETLTAQSVLTPGGMETGPSAQVDVTNVYTYQSGGGDPYADLSTPTTNSCAFTNYSSSNGGTATPGVYCGGMSISGSKTLNLTPGVYVMKGGDFKVTGSAGVTCNGCTGGQGVTILLVPGSNGSVGTVNLGGSTVVQFPAPSVDTAYGGVNFRGLAVVQDRSATPGNAAKFDGSGNLKISGAIYMPQANVTWIGTSDLPTGYACVEIIGLTVNVQGNSRMTLTDCPAMGVKPVKATGTVALLE
jgi:hypothetical protein